MRSLAQASIALFFIFPALVLAKSPVSGGFSAAASPPRYELRGDAGKVIREILTIYNFGLAPEQYRIHSTEWMMSANNDMLFGDALNQNSCRPWLRLERHKITVTPQRPRKFRFELHVPEDAPKGECTFAIMIEGLDGGAVTQIAPGISVPVEGRIAVIVYLDIGGVKPDLKIMSYGVTRYGKSMVPSIIVKNQGKAHGRLSGLLSGKDTGGTEYDISVSSLPIMPGQTRTLLLNPTLPRQKESKPVSVKYPISIKGDIFWEGGEFKVDKKITP